MNTISAHLAAYLGVSRDPACEYTALAFAFLGPGAAFWLPSLSLSLLDLPVLVRPGPWRVFLCVETPASGLEDGIVRESSERRVSTRGCECSD